MFRHVHLGQAGAGSGDACYGNMHKQATFSVPPKPVTLKYTKHSDASAGRAKEGTRIALSSFGPPVGEGAVCRFGSLRGTQAISCPP